MGNANRSADAATYKPKHHNRVRAIMLHGSRYSCYPTSHLAADTGVAKSTISHLVHGRTNPLYSTALRVVKCLEADLGRPLDCREIFSENGKYPTASVCELLGCPGCTPPWFFDDVQIKSQYRFLQMGRWSGDTAEAALPTE
jgi:transcriptional regulator with XRE-family HTH domain